MRTKTKLLLIGGSILVVLVLLIIRNKTAMNAPTQTSSITTAYSVSVVTVTKQSLDERISVVGTINAFNDVTVVSETQGRVVKVNVEVGDVVKAGSVLVEVDSELKDAAFKVAQVSYEKARKDLARYEALFKEHSIPDSQIEQARWTYQTAEAQFVVARRQLSDTRITTPISGVVTARFVNVGVMVMGAPQATQIANVVDLSRLKAKVNVAEHDVFQLHSGDQVDISSDVYPNVTFAGTIFSVSSKGDDSHTYPVEVVVKDPHRQLKAGMFAQVTFRPKPSGPMLLVPRQAIVGSMQNPKLFIVKDNIAVLHSVVTAKEIGTQVAIAGGLNEGDSVVVDGQNNLTDNVTVVVRQQ
jgi:RND family efflux transporter MFP subunit